MATVSSSHEPAQTMPIPDDEHVIDLPLTMSASVVLTALPRDAHSALANAQVLEKKKATIRFKAVGSAPILRTTVFKVSATQRFETVINFLRTRLKCKPSDSVFCYVNSVFSPAPDEIVGNLFRVRVVDSLVLRAVVPM
ncbi:MAG: Ubiquitin-like protein [Pycnora praestabilis]|nr:MAG: Ubiquitin-like protein [Pycnora praestabilis]